ncbi:MAG: hypothetical protein F4Z76_03630 [Rhodothermaceae bacterium]|nr:hypothetical protein [Rhodothermaceae bacterium]
MRLPVRFEENGLSWERLSHSMIEPDGFLCGLGGQKIFCVRCAIPNNPGLDMTEFCQDLSLAQSLFFTKEGMGSMA